jgi:hypothetical protein
MPIHIVIIINLFVSCFRRKINILLFTVYFTVNEERLPHTAYVEMHKYLSIYEEAISHIWLSTLTLLNFLIYWMRKIFFTF